MARRYWRSGRPVKNVLSEEPYRFDPFQAARLLEALQPMAPHLATSTDPRAEAMRFVGAAALGFPPSAIAAITGPLGAEHAPENWVYDRPEVTVTFLDLIGQNGPLPHAYTEMVRDRLAHRDPAMKAFLDLFLHRLVSVMIRAKRRHLPGLDNSPPDQGHMTGYLRALLGLGTARLADRLAVPDRLLLRYAALFAHRPRSAAGLTQILADMLQTPVRAHLLRGDWLPIADADQTHLANSRGWDGQNARLGQGAVLGTRAWTQTEALELEIGPLTLPRFRDLLPGGADYLRIASVIHFYLERELNVTLRLILQRAEMPRLRITRRGSSSTPGDHVLVPSLTPPRLGYTSWLTTRFPRHDDTQAALRLPSATEVATLCAAKSAANPQAKATP
jgi:type VI secretion system protein ImpH